jgi:hypothetical protein
MGHVAIMNSRSESMIVREAERNMVLYMLSSGES